MSRVKLVSVKCFEVFTEGGESLGLFKQESEWKGMRCLRSMEGGNQLIIDGDPSIFGEIFGDIFGKERAAADVVKAAPDIIVKLIPATSCGFPCGSKCPKCSGGPE